jgi:hypothetical protein
MPQLARWRLRLQDMDFTIRYLSGPRNLCSDGLSRQHVDEVEVTMGDVIPESALPNVNEAVYADIAALKIEFSGKYGDHKVDIAPVATRRRINGSERSEEDVDGLVSTEPALSYDYNDDDALSFVSESSDSSCTENDSVIDLTEAGADGGGPLLARQALRGLHHYFRPKDGSYVNECNRGVGGHGVRLRVG